MLRLVFLSVVFSVCGYTADLPLGPSTTGFYPLWENTGHVERHGHVYLGTGSSHIGILDRVQIGVDPVEFAYRTPNVNMKSKLWSEEQISISLQGGVYHLLERASRSTMSPEYPSRLDNPDFTMTLYLASLTNTYTIGSWLDLHQTVTALTVTSSGPISNQLSLAHALVSEFLPQNRHSINLHWTDVGLWNHDNTILGASYRYRNTWLEFRLGYFYRLRKLGNRNGPLIGLGFLL